MNLFKTYINECKKVLFNCCNIILNINNILRPYFVDITNKVEEYLNTNINEWNYKKTPSINLKAEIEPLFIRYDKKLIEDKKTYLSSIKDKLL